MADEYVYSFNYERDAKGNILADEAGNPILAKPQSGNFATTRLSETWQPGTGEKDPVGNPAAVPTQGHETSVVYEPSGPETMYPSDSIQKLDPNYGERSVMITEEEIDLNPQLQSSSGTVRHINPKTGKWEDYNVGGLPGSVVPAGTTYDTAKIKVDGKEKTVRVATNPGKILRTNFPTLKDTLPELVYNKDQTQVQNPRGFPFSTRNTWDKTPHGLDEAETDHVDPESGSWEKYSAPQQYDYQIIIDDSRFQGTLQLEEQLKNARAALGIQVHGDRDIAKTMRYYLYNRFKVPDTNMAHNKSFTHVFFTRPDLNIMEMVNGRPTIASQCQFHTESALLWQRNPGLFKLLIDNKRAVDTDNFNMLLSNAVDGFTFEDEKITEQDAGKSWGGYAMKYGNTYDGRSAGQINLSFVDDKQYSVLNMLKLWITYIDNVSKGAWLPSYDLYGEGVTDPIPITQSHVYTRTLDYAASVYVFKTSEDGSDIIYWTKYYGVFPTNTGANALSWEKSGSTGDAPKLNVTFCYSFKRDMSPVSLLEFNRNACVPSHETLKFEEAWASQYNHSNRPYVGTPFIEMSFPGVMPALGTNIVHDVDVATLRLRFRPSEALLGNKITDDQMYSADPNTIPIEISQRVPLANNPGLPTYLDWYRETSAKGSPTMSLEEWMKVNAPKEPERKQNNNSVSVSYLGSNAAGGGGGGGGYSGYSGGGYSTSGLTQNQVTAFNSGWGPVSVETANRIVNGPQPPQYNGIQGMTAQNDGVTWVWTNIGGSGRNATWVWQQQAPSSPFPTNSASEAFRNATTNLFGN